MRSPAWWLFAVLACAGLNCAQPNVADGGSGGNSGAGGGAGGSGGDSGTCPLAAAGGAPFPRLSGSYPVVDGGIDVGFPQATRLMVADYFDTSGALPVLVVGGGGSELRGFVGFVDYDRQGYFMQTTGLPLSGAVEDLVGWGDHRKLLTRFSPGPLRASAFGLSYFTPVDQVDLPASSTPSLGFGVAGSTIVERTANGFTLTDPTRPCWNQPWVLNERQLAVPARSFAIAGTDRFAVATEAPALYSTVDLSVLVPAPSNPGATLDHLVAVYGGSGLAGFIGWDTSASGGPRLQAFRLTQSGFLVGAPGPAVADLKRSTTGAYRRVDYGSDSLVLIDGTRVRVFQVMPTQSDITLTEVASYDVPDPRDLAMWDFGVDAGVDLIVLSGVAPELRVFRPDGG